MKRLPPSQCPGCPPVSWELAPIGLASRAGAGGERQRAGDIRAWAKEHGLAVSERGRIPAGVVEQYNVADGR